METSSHTWLTSRTKIGLCIAFAAGLSLSSGGASSDAAPGGSNVQDEWEIQKLSTCYARGTDTIAAGDLGGGKNIYRGCFTNDAEFVVYFPGADMNGPPTFVTNGTDSWANFVQSTFSAYGYTYTQHFIGNVQVQVTGNHATMSSYLHATELRPDGTIDSVNGTYEDQVVWAQGQWKIKRRTVKLFTLLNLGTPVP